jgi:hypothetical protein
VNGLIELPPPPRFRRGDRARPAWSGSADRSDCSPA